LARRSGPRRQPARSHQQGQQAAARGGAKKLAPAFSPFLGTVHSKRSNNNTKSFLYEQKNGYSRIVNY